MARESGKRGGGSGLVLSGMTAANAMILVDQTAVPLALPDIMQDFGVGSQNVQWVLNASLLMLAGLLVLGGRLGDLLGRRRVFLAGCLLFSGGSAVAGLAPAFEVLIAARVVQGVGGALMLPTSVALVSAAFGADRKGRALGTMGGVAAVAGALGPTIGGVLTTAVSWRAVFLVNVPLAVFCVLVTLRAVPADAPRTGRVHVDISGSALFCVALVSGVYGLSRTQATPFTDASVAVPLVAAAVAAALFVARERRAANPLLSFSLLRANRNYLGATLSQGLAGMAEMGLGIIFPLLLVLNLEMTPALAGLALIPTTLPMIVLAPVTGRWYDRSGGRRPLVVGFLALAASGVALAIGVYLANDPATAPEPRTYLALLPGFLLYGIGLALVLTANDPVSLDSIPEQDEGQASGVSATAEQGGGAVGIAIFYALFHTAYIGRLHDLLDGGTLAGLSAQQYAQLRSGLQAAEQTGLQPDHFDPTLLPYLGATYAASQHAYIVVFLAVSAVGVLGAVATGWLVRRPT
ncbi:MAG: MFS transporter [Acidimicrobiales bacterium]|nr:MFS transporter [Acidimicrobiales bacterium]